MKLVNDAWKGRRCFIVGGGPSLKDFNWDLLKNELWIGINAVWLHAVPTISYTHDKRVIELFYKEHKNAWKNLPCRVHKHLNQLTGQKDKFGEILTFQGCKVWSKSLEQGLFNGNNSGVTALNLAEILGANPIYLLGFDMKSKDGATQFHNHYPAGWKQPDTVYKNFKTAFSRNRCFLKSEVINLGPDSDLDCFPKKTIEEVLKFE